MNKTYRVLGKRGRITIPFEIRQELGFAYNDIVSFEIENGNTVTVKREKICNECRTVEPETADTISLRDFLDGLPEQEQRAALIHLSVKWASKAAMEVKQ